MMLFARAVVTGFGLSLGAAIFKKVQKQLGLEEKTDKQTDETVRQDGATDPNLRQGNAEA
jgi:hypothetical protein